MARFVPGDVQRYDGQFVIVCQHTAQGVWVRYEEDRTNTEYLVPANKLS
jgi:hypothetical protein